VLAPTSHSIAYLKSSKVELNNERNDMDVTNVFSKTILKLQRTLAISGSIFIVLGVSCGAFFRYVLGVSFHGLEELLVIGSFWMYFVGASYASYERKHISAEVFSIYCTVPSLRYSVAILADLITFGLSALYTFWGWEFLTWSLEAGGQTARLQIPLVVGHSAVFFGFALMSSYFFIDLLRQVQNLKESFNTKPDNCQNISDF
jgi:TRAP-type C4-dicarboxylate transport system permease small subunit